MSDVYSIDYALRDSEQRHHILAELEDISREFQLSGKKILELGCGFGHNLALFASDNQVRGIESNPEIAAKTAARGIETLNHDLDAGLPDPDESWDVVICLDVLEHLLRPLECAREISRVLKPGGIAILNVPNHFILKVGSESFLAPTLMYIVSFLTVTNGTIRIFVSSPIGVSVICS